MAERSKARVCGRSLAGVAGLNPGGSMDVWVVSVLQKRQKAKCMTIKTQKLVGMKYRERTRESKKIPPGAWRFLLFFKRISDLRTQDMEIHNGQKGQNKRKKRKDKQKNDSQEPVAESLFIVN